MDNIVRALCEVVADYHELHRKCWTSTPEECKELMTDEFPRIQGFSMLSLIEEVGKMPFNSEQAVVELEACKASSNSEYKSPSAQSCQNCNELKRCPLHKSKIKWCRYFKPK